jgi:hypothetical protein
LMRSGGPESSPVDPMSTQFSSPAMAIPLPIVLIDARAYHFVEYNCALQTGHDSGKARRIGVRRPWVDRIGGHFEAWTSAG